MTKTGEFNIPLPPPTPNPPKPPPVDTSLRGRIRRQFNRVDPVSAPTLLLMEELLDEIERLQHRIDQLEQ
jgi:hypothetical protein